MLESAKSAYDENSDVVLSYQRQLNTATVELIKFDRELKNTDKYLDEAAQSADGTASSIDEFGKAVKDAGDEGSDGMGQLKEAFGQLGEAAKSGDINGVVAALGSMKGVLVGGAAVAGAKALADGIINITESTKEYRTILGTLEVSSKQAGYTQEQTTEIYKKFQAVLGDTQKAATATANLQALGLSQENLRIIMEQAIGAWATYGDSIPIDSLSESINETVQWARSPASLRTPSTGQAPARTSSMSAWRPAPTLPSGPIWCCSSYQSRAYRQPGRRGWKTTRTSSPPTLPRRP
mgnify:CR=1 FL=1